MTENQLKHVIDTCFYHTKFPQVLTCSIKENSHSIVNDVHVEGGGGRKYTLMWYRPCTWSAPSPKNHFSSIFNYKLLNQNDLPNIKSP